MTEFKNPTPQVPDQSTSARITEAGAVTAGSWGVGLFRLSGDWLCVIRRAWSIRLMLIAGVFSAAEVALPLLDGFLPVGPGVFAMLSGLATGGAFVSRLVAQQNLEGDA